MGLILFGSMLIFFYIAKLFFPQWIIGVAETPRLIEIGNYIDNSIPLKLLASELIGLVFGYIYCCACLQVPKLDQKGFIIFLTFLTILTLSPLIDFSFYTIFNYVNTLFVPLLIALVSKRFDYKVVISTVICFIVDTASQILSIQIRDLTQMVHNINTATMLVLCIDLYIWRILLYFYFNEKRRQE